MCIRVGGIHGEIMAKALGQCYWKEQSELRKERHGMRAPPDTVASFHSLNGKHFVTKRPGGRVLRDPAAAALRALAKQTAARAQHDPTTYYAAYSHFFGEV